MYICACFSLDSDHKYGTSELHLFLLRRHFRGFQIFPFFGAFQASELDIEIEVRSQIEMMLTGSAKNAQVWTSLNVTCCLCLQILNVTRYMICLYGYPFNMTC